MTTLYARIIDFPRESIQYRWIRSRQASFGEKYLLSRGVHLILSPASFITCALDLISGVIAGIATWMTLGLHQKIAETAREYLFTGSRILSYPFQFLLQTINPKANFSSPSSQTAEGLLTDSMRKFLISKADISFTSSNFFMRHIVTRLIYLALLIASLITRIVDLALGILALPFAFLTFGIWEPLNFVVYRGLQITGIVSDIFFSLSKVINPATAFELDLI